MHHLTCLLLIALITLTCCTVTQAEESVLWLQVSNPLGQPIPNVVLSAAGPSSSSAPTGVTNGATEVSGKARIKLVGSTRPGDEVELILVKAPQDLVFISPWHQRVTVPCFDNSTRCVAKVVLAERGSRMLLEYPPAQLALVAKVNAANAAAAGGNEPVEWQRQASLVEVAEAYGYAPEDVDQAIRELGRKTTDSYELGQVALYERDYPEAEKQLSKSKAERKEHLKKARGELAEVIISLAQTYYEQGKYEEAAREFQEAGMLRPSDSGLVNGLGNAYLDAGQYDKAEKCYRRALKMDESTFGPEHSNVSISLNNLAALYDKRGKYADAERLHKRSLAIRLKHFGPDQPEVADSLNNLATVYANQGRYAEAEKLFKEAIMIFEKQLGTDHPNVALGLRNLATVYEDQRRYADAESLVERAMVIYETHFGPEHFRIASNLEYLAGLYRDQGRHADAEPLYKRAFAIIEKSLGPEHPGIVSLFENYALLLRKTNRSEEADRMERRARAIQAKQK